VAGYVPNTAEAVIAFLATASLGAVWSGCGQDYSPAAAAERLGQLEPSVLIAADGYRYGGSRSTVSWADAGSSRNRDIRTHYRTPPTLPGR
jgi:acyl-coenzyme A synthetase/AMP-(fatty) acid ligase